MVVKNEIKQILVVGLILLLSACGGAEERKANYLEKGKNYLSEKNYDKARIEFKNVLQIDPKYAEGYFYIGQIEEHNKELAKAVGNYLKAIELDPAHLRAKIKLAKIYTLVSTDEFLDKANELLNQVLAVEQGNAEARLIVATIKYKKGSKEDATREIEAIIAKTPSLIEGVGLLTAIYISNNQQEKALQLLEKTIKTHDDISLKLTLARLYARNKINDKAEAQLKQIIELDPDNFAFRVVLSSFYSASDRAADAEAVLRTAIADQPDEVNRYLALVEFLSSRKNVKEAEAELLNAISQKPDLIELQFALTEFYEKTGRADKSIDVLNKIIQSEKLKPAGLKARIQLAEFHMSKNNVTDAQKLVDEVLTENPSDNSGLHLNAKIAYAKMDDVTVINALRTVLKNEPKNSEAALVLAKAHERNNESELAHEVLLRILETDPLNPENHVNEANYLASKGKLDEALKTLDQALAYFKNDYDLLDAKFSLLAAMKDEQGMLNVLELMKTFYPNRDDVYLKEGHYHFFKKQYEKALNEYKLALANTSNIYTTLEAVARTYIALGRESDAVIMLNDRISKNPGDTIAYQVLGQVYAQNDKAKALEYLEKAMSASKWEQPYISAASIHASAGDNDKALQVLERGVAVTANPALLQMQVAAIYERQQQFDKAINTYEKVLLLNPINLIAANNLASLLVDYRDDADSYKRALELVKDFDRTNQPALIDTLGWVLLKNKDTTGAVATLQKAVQLAPNIAIFQYHLGAAYQQTGDVAQAKRYLTAAVENKQDYPGKDKAKELLATL